MTEDLPPRQTLQRWRGEPVKAIIFPTSIFLTNKKGFPVLSKPHQLFVLEMYQFKIQVILKGLKPPVAPRGPYMPAFADALDDRQVAEVVAYLQARHGTGPAWPDLEKDVAAARKEGE